MKIDVRKSEDRGKLKIDWLFARYSFSFANYYDPKFTGFSDLLVLNQDIVSPNGGFAPHSHKDMEIVTYIIRGNLEHKDSMGNKAQITAGEIQRMSAGSGVTHSEYNALADKETELLQIWISPATKGLKPSYEQRALESFGQDATLRLLVSPGREQQSLGINQDVKFYSSVLEKNDEVVLPFAQDRRAWIQVIKGEIRIVNTLLASGDGAAISDVGPLAVSAVQDSHFLFIDLR